MAERVTGNKNSEPSLETNTYDVTRQVLEYWPEPERLIAPAWTIRPLNKIRKLMDEYRISSLYLEKNSPEKQRKIKTIVYGKEEHRIRESTPQVDVIALVGQTVADESKRNEVWASTIALQTQLGCNGGCRFCLFGTKGRGIEAVMSTESTIRAIKTITGQVSTKGVEKDPLFLYWDSDPLDNPDVYKLAEEYYRTTGEKLCISTAMPLGSLDTFIDMHRQAYEAYRERGRSGIPFNVRVSAGLHNIRRIEYAFAKTAEVLSQEDGVPIGEAAIFLGCTIGSIDPKVGEDNLFNVGGLINHPGRNNVAEIFSPACVDGVVISPREVGGGGEKKYGIQIDQVAIVAATPYEISGSASFGLSETPQVVAPRNIQNYTWLGNNYPEDVYRTYIEEKRVMLPRITDRAGEVIGLENEEADFYLFVGREVVSIGLAIRDISGVSLSGRELARELGYEYLKTVSSVYKERRTGLQEYLEKQIEEGDPVKIEFYKQLAGIYQEAMDLLTTQIDQGAEVDTLAAIAVAVLNVNENNATQLGEIVEAIENLTPRRSDSQPADREYAHKWKQQVGKYWGLEQTEDEQLPAWAKSYLNIG